MKEPIPIDENMPDKLKTAINYLNENNISLTDKIDVNKNFDDSDDDMDDEDFDGYISEEDLEDSETIDDDDEIIEEDENVDLSDLDSIF